MPSVDFTEPALSVQLEQLALRAIKASYNDLNLTFFGGALKRPVIELSSTSKRLGQFDAEFRTIELSRKLLNEHAWGVLLEVLKHEMAHQYVYEVLGMLDETAHGPVFRQVCEKRGFDARASGIPEATLGAEPEFSVLGKIARLLSLAQSSNEHEAQAAMNAAQRLMLKHNLKEVSEGRLIDYGFRHLGEPSGRVNEGQRVLATILVDYFFVETIWIPVWRAREGKRGSVLEVCGSRANLEMAHYVYSFLTHTAERLWREHKKSARLTGNKDRRAFVAGVMAGFRDKLAKERQLQKSDGLIWLGDPALHGFLKTRHPHVRYAHYVSSARQSAHAEGRAAGSRIVLHKGVSSAPSGAPKLLRARSKQ